MTTLTAALNSSFAGIRSTEARISTVSSNINNADKVGYTRKTFQSDYFTSNGGVLPVGGKIVSTILNPFLQEQLINDTSAASQNEKIYEFLSQYADRLGTTEGKNTLNASMDKFAAALEQLYVSPEDNGLKFQAVASAQRLAADLNDLSRNVQNLRLQANIEIDQTVDRINQSVQRIDDLNKAIALSASTGVSTADLIDQRAAEMTLLAEELSIQYFTDNNNQMKLYTESGLPLLDGSVRNLTYTASNFVNSTVTYPGGFDNIQLSGLDITTTLGSSGKLGALIEIRDTTLVEEQEKLDEFATALTREMNKISNQGASFPAPPIMTGDANTATLPAIGGAAGFIRIATTDQNGLVTSFTDFNVATFGNVAGMVAAVNGAAGLDVTASLNANGQFVLTANTAGEGVAINDHQINGTASDMDGNGTGFSQFFGMNNVFYSPSLGAEDIEVSASLILDSNHFPTSRLSSDAGLAIGDVGANPGDGSIADELNDQLTAAINFNAAGNFAAQTNSLDGYTDILMSDLASRASKAKADAEITTLALKQTSSTLYNLQGVNIDEENTHLLDLEYRYKAAATLLKKIQKLLDELMNAIR